MSLEFVPADVLEFLARHPHGWRYRQLIDPEHPDYQPEYLDLVRAWARGEQPPGPSAPPSVEQQLARVSACPHRGGVLPVSQQPECGCAELSECRAGRGQRPGAVTLQDCLRCVSTP